MSLKELNGRLTNQPYLAGYTPSKEDATAFAEMFANNTAVIQWAARMASYYQEERDALVAPAAAKPAAATAPAPAKAAPAPKKAAADDDDVDLFGEETEEETAAKEAKKKADDEKKAAKKVVIAKSSILLDVKPWEDTTNLQELADKVKSEVIDGLVWGAHKFVTVAYGLKKLQILFVIEDDKVSSEDIEDLFTAKYEEYVQSIDIVAWNKI